MPILTRSKTADRTFMFEYYVQVIVANAAYIRHCAKNKNPVTHSEVLKAIQFFANDEANDNE